MRRFIGVVLLLLLARGAYAAEYIVQQGDTVRSVALALGHTPYQIQRMNSLELMKADEHLVPGTSIVYVSRDDFECARMEVSRLAEPLTGKDRETWDALLEGFNEGMQFILYLPNSGDGLTYSRVLAFARQWRRDH